MNLLTLKIKTEKDLQLFISLANKLDAEIIELDKEEKINDTDPVYWLQKISAMGGVKSISNPEEWQKQLRQDNKLPNR